MHATTSDGGSVGIRLCQGAARLRNLRGPEKNIQEGKSASDISPHTGERSIAAPTTRRTVRGHDQRRRQGARHSAQQAVASRVRVVGAHQMNRWSCDSGGGCGRSGWFAIISGAIEAVGGGVPGAGREYRPLLKAPTSVGRGIWQSA